MLSDTDPIVEFKGAAKRSISLTDAARPSAGSRLRLGLLASLSRLAVSALLGERSRAVGMSVGEVGWRLGITRRAHVAIEDGERA